MLALFISYLSARQLAPSTITSYISAISDVHKIKSFSNPRKSFLIQKLLTVVNRRRKSDIRLPISCPVLHELLRSLRFTNSSVFQRTLYRAMFLLSIYGFFRICGLAANSAKSVSTILQFSALQFLILDGKAHFVKLVMSENKHNANNRSFEILIPREDCPAQFCPVQTILDYLVLRGNRPGLLFCPLSLAPITADQFNTELQRCLSFCCLDTRRYKGRSFRIGAASHAALFAAGIPIPLRFTSTQSVCLRIKFVVSRSIV